MASSAATGVTYDSGALIAADRGHRRIWALHRQTLERGLIPTVPSVVLAQAWRGGPHAQISRLLAGCQIQPLDERTARMVGVACAASQTSDIVDAAVVVSSAERGDLIVTSDPEDIARLLDALGLKVTVVTL